MKETRDYVRLEAKSRALAFDYALGISILGLIPIDGLLTAKLLIAISLLIKMLWDIGVKWKFAKGQDILAIAGYVFGFIGALAIAFMAWLTLLAIGLFIPYVSSLKVAAALFTLTWVLGQNTNQFYASGHKKINKEASK
ncbi:hypothetical protein Xen7305DRAFT_00026700 [Xenococcus sp. PCC 7305]|uniref:hypothetical protein n=1 Tax=Xenococcus sp. PCC 7305 TaxID=102125 RepID=UPI0002ABCC63|nr:hypothetical protein [Xenococcus sp. PCC 7305]ELS02952.1 hypothetical protein Xen7305DRAFT_00026700 [Xenococcus sp. PCC 7305]